MKPYYERDGITIYHGDCLEILPSLDPESADMVFTDPPYGNNKNNGDLIERWEAALPCGGIGEDGPTLKELESIPDTEFWSGDAMYHRGQEAWRLLQYTLFTYGADK